MNGREAQKVSSTMSKQLPFWLELISNLEFFEDPPGGDSGDGNGDNNNGGDGTDGGDDEDDDSTQELSPQDNKELLRALREERANRKRLEKEKKTRDQEAADKELKEKDEITQLSTKLSDREEKLGRLGKAYLKNALDSAIEREARNLRFIDVSDAIAGVDRAVIIAEQEDDDPAVVVIDTASLKKAVKQLADKKKHLIRVGTEDGSPTGSSYGGGNGKGQTSAQLQEAELRKHYPNL